MYSSGIIAGKALRHKTLNIAKGLSILPVVCIIFGTKPKDPGAQNGRVKNMNLSNELQKPT